MIFVLLGRRNALCLARHNRAKSAEIHRFKAGSDLSLYPKEAFMTQFTILLDPAAALLYSRIASATGKPVEQVLSDALFKLAGELSLEALNTQ